jgi:hypothetical protein
VRTRLKFGLRNLCDAIPHAVGFRMGSNCDLVGRSILWCWIGDCRPGWKKPKLSAVSVSRPVGKLLIMMAGFALLAGSLGFVFAQRRFISPPKGISVQLPQEKHSRFMADWWAHNTSYGAGLFGGVILCVLQYRKRSVASSVEMIGIS